MSIATSNIPEVTAAPGSGSPVSSTTSEAPAAAPLEQPSDAASVDDKPAEAAPSVTETTPADPAGASKTEEVQAAPTETTGGVVDESTIDWNGELDSLESAEWFTTNVDEKYRNPLLEGMRKKYKNLESGFTKKTQELAETRKSIEADLAAVKAKDAERERELNYYRRFLDTGQAPSEQMVAEAKELREQLAQSKVDRAALEAEIREALAAELREKELTPLQQELQKEREEREALTKTLDEQKQAAEAAAQARNEQVLSQLEQWVDKAAPALWEDENEPALELFENLLRSQAAKDPETALKMVGSVYPQLDPTAAEEVPDSVAVMNADSTVSYGQMGEGEDLSYAALKERMLRGVVKS